jgi:hypothetical protein
MLSNVKKDKMPSPTAIGIKEMTRPTTPRRPKPCAHVRCSSALMVRTV